MADFFKLNVFTIFIHISSESVHRTLILKKIVHLSFASKNVMTVLRVSTPVSLALHNHGSLSVIHSHLYVITVPGDFVCLFLRHVT